MPFSNLDSFNRILGRIQSIDARISTLTEKPQKNKSAFQSNSTNKSNSIPTSNPTDASILDSLNLDPHDLSELDFTDSSRDFIKGISSKKNNDDLYIDQITNLNKLNSKKDSNKDFSFANILEQTREKLPNRSNKWVVEDAIQNASQKTGLDINLIKAVVRTESGGNSNAISSVGAQGLMQLMPQTAAGLGVKNPFDPHENALGGAQYLKEQLQTFKGNVSLALAAYNAGPAAVIKHNGIPPYRETMDYVKKVEAAYRDLESKSNISGPSHSTSQNNSLAASLNTSGNIKPKASSLSQKNFVSDLNQAMPKDFDFNSFFKA
jgi:hypothetical protein